MYFEARDHQQIEVMEHEYSISFGRSQLQISVTHELVSHLTTQQAVL